jgi:hypothetical protein
MTGEGWAPGPGLMALDWQRFFRGINAPAPSVSFSPGVPENSLRRIARRPYGTLGLLWMLTQDCVRCGGLVLG